MCLNRWWTCFWKHPFLLPPLLKTCGSWLTFREAWLIWTERVRARGGGKTTFLKLSEEHCHHHIQSSSDLVYQLVELFSMKIGTDSYWFPIGLGCCLGYEMHLNVLFAEGIGVGKTKFTEKKFQNIDISDKGTSISFATMYFSFQQTNKRKKRSVWALVYETCVSYTLEQKWATTSLSQIVTVLAARQLKISRGFWGSDP